MKRRAYRLADSCRRCGACCRAPTIQVHPSFLHLKGVRRSLLAWHRIVNGFEIDRIDRRNVTLIFRCTHFDPETRRCDSYANRPGICRDYPENLLDSPAPEFFESYGFRAVAKNAESLSDALQDAGIAPETLQELKKKLHLE